MEHRCSPRISTDLKVHLGRNKQQCKGRLRNCSTLGFYIEANDHGYALHQLIAVDIALCDIDGNAYTFVFEGRVVRKGQHFIALELEAHQLPTPGALNFIEILKQAQQPAQPQRRLG
ncbi:PilZ domain-containing protein [Gilvimarinus agarilyticus]|uniref:PilZ domain-containing protein n=1 Tax=Gilvimarinus agarilyticus TaxID=679259 RepID=UPI00059F2E9D|nr:PilZ domain-containing protein [Gilvimarinus agarilyticus]